MSESLSRPLILTSDWQASFPNLPRCEQMLEELLRSIRYRCPGAVIHLGDVKEQFSPLDLRVLDFCVGAVKQITALCPLYILKGNHDMHGTTDAAHNFLHILELAGATVITKPVVHTICDTRWGFLPFAYSLDTQRQWSDWLVGQKATYLAFHAEVRGCLLNHSRKSTTGLTWAELGTSNYRACFGGHLHRYQRRDNMLYVGSAFAQDWSDANSRKGNVLLKETGSMTRLLTKVPGYHDPVLKDFVAPHSWEGAFLRVQVPCERNDDVHAKIHLQARRTADRCAGAHIKVVPKFVDDPKPDDIEADTDAEALAKYVRETYQDEEPTPATALTVLQNYLGVSTGRNKGRVQFIQAKGKNFLSYRQVHLQFHDGITLIRGQNNDWDGKSNGAGKTCLLQMIAVALFGTTFKKQKSDRWARRGSKGPAWVAVQFRLEDGRLCIVRRQRRPSRLQLFIEGKDVSTGRGLAGVQADIEQLTGLTLPTLANAVYIDQAVISEFLYGTDAGRFKLLQRFMNLERFDRAMTDVKAEITRIEGNRERVERERLIRDDRIKTAQAEIDKAGKDIDTDAANRIWEDTNTEFVVISTKAQARIVALTGKIRTMVAHRDQLIRKASKVSGTCSALRAEMAELDKAQSDATKLKGQNCPVCQQQITAASLQKHCAEITRRKTRYTDRVGRLTTWVARADELIEEEAAQLTTWKKRRAQWREKVAYHEGQLAKARRDLSRAQWKKNNLSGHCARITELRRALNIDNMVLQDIESELAFQRYCTSVFHRDGLPKFIGRLFYPRLNRAARFYSEMFTGGQIQVRFEVTDEGVCPEIINVLGGERLEDQSEGERRFASIITSFALRDVSDPCNVLVLDEPGMGLDPGNARDFSKALLQNHDRFGCVMLVTHNQHIEETLKDVRTLVVTKQDGISQVQPQ